MVQDHFLAPLGRRVAVGDTAPFTSRGSQQKSRSIVLLFCYPSRRLGISSDVSRYIIKGGVAAFVSHHALACILLRLDDIQNFVLMICNSCGIDDIQGFALIFKLSF